MAEAILQPFQSEFLLVAFFAARYDPRGVCDSCAYHHQIHPANETWIMKQTEHYYTSAIDHNNIASFLHVLT